MSTCRSVSSSSPAPFRSGIGGVSTGLASRSSLQLGPPWGFGPKTISAFLATPLDPGQIRPEFAAIRRDAWPCLDRGPLPRPSRISGSRDFPEPKSAPVRDPSPPDFTCGSAPWLSLLDSPWAPQAQPLTPSIPILRCHRFWPALQVQIASAREPLVVNLRQHG